MSSENRSWDPTHRKEQLSLLRLHPAIWVHRQQRLLIHSNDATSPAVVAPGGDGWTLAL